MSNNWNEITAVLEPGAYSTAIMNAVDKVTAVKERAQRENYSPEYTEQIYTEALAELEKTQSQLIEDEQARIESELVTLQHKFIASFGADDDPVKLQRHGIKYKSMSDGELRTEATRYASGQSAVMQPHELEMICAELRARGQTKVADGMREAMLANNYREPWRQLIEASDTAFIENAKGRLRGDIVLKLQRNGSRASSKMNIANILKIRGIK